MDGKGGKAGYGLSEIAAEATAAAPALDYLPPRPHGPHPNVALIGCGGIAEYHLRAYRAMGLDVAMLCDRNLARAEKRRAEFYPAAEVGEDYREVLRRDDVAVVDVAIHPAERAEIIGEALRAGKHVLSQKPFVLDLAEGELLVALARERGLRLAVNQNGRWAPHFSYLAAAVRAGVVGEVASVDFSVQWDHTWTEGTVFDGMRHLVLLDFGIHWFDIATRFMAGRRPDRVTASVARTPFQRMKSPILAQAAVDYPGAQVRFAFNGHVRHGQEDRTVICGSLGTLRSFGPSLSEQTVELHTAKGRASPHLDGTWFANGFQGTMGELLCAIEDGREPSNGAGDNLGSLALCFAAMESADSGQPRIPGSVTRAPGHDGPAPS
jgi:predicted dehydrogenase